MDDEAEIRIWMIIAISFVALVGALTFGIGWATHQGAAVAEANASAKVGIVAIAACKTLPVDQRSSCIEHVVDAPTRSAGYSTCNSQYDDAAQTVCEASVDGQTISPGTAAVLGCDRIQGDDSAVIRCIADAVAGKAKKGG